MESSSNLQRLLSVRWYSDAPGTLSFWCYSAPGQKWQPVRGLSTACSWAWIISRFRLAKFNPRLAVFEFEIGNENACSQLSPTRISKPTRSHQSPPEHLWAIGRLPRSIVPEALC